MKMELQQCNQNEKMPMFVSRPQPDIENNLRNELLAALNDDTTHQNEIKRILDSKLLKNADNIIEIDLRDILTKKSLSLLEILDKDMEVFEKFMKREEWGGSSCHPVLTLTIELKTLMFKKVYNWNLLLFIILFMVPFFTLYVVRYFYTPGYTASLPLETAYNATRCVCVFSVIYLATISIVKLVFFYESPSSDNEKGNEFWRQKDNLIEVILVLLASPTIFCFWFGTADTYKPLIVILGVISFISLICKIHSSVFPIQAMIVKRLAYSFMGYLIIPVIFIFVLKRSKTMMESLFHHEVGINLDHYNDTSSDDHDMETDEEHFTNMDDTEESFLDMMMEESLFVFEILICCIIAFLLVSKDLIKFTGPEKQDNVARMNAQNYIDISKKFNVASRNFKKYHNSTSKCLGTLVNFVKKISNWLLNEYPELHNISEVTVDRTGAVRAENSDKKIYTMSAYEYNRVLNSSAT